MSSSSLLPETAVSVRGLSKSYTLSHNSPQHTTMAEALIHGVKNLGRKQTKETFWALKDVSFEINKGDVVGIIGRNGAGKSTLLKVLSRITEPTTGQIDLYGRVGSLLEVGTGFHPELTGRENTYLNGAILGMSKQEIGKHFDAIVEFAGVEKFLDTPVKRYSSGMYVRLAFAVAAHLEPEILIVDEVLAVGDAEFQKKCLGKMQDVAAHGRTVIFVSHNMAAITRLCKKAIFMEQGRVIASGNTSEVTSQYVHSGGGNKSERVYRTIEEAPGDEIVRLKSVRVKNTQGHLTDTIDVRDPVYIEVEYWNQQHGSRPTVILHFLNEEGLTLFATNDFNNRVWWQTPRQPGLVKAVCEVPGNILAEGHLFVMAALGTYNPNHIHAMVPDAVQFQIVDHSEGDAVRGESRTEWPGVMRPMLNWDVVSQDDFTMHQSPENNNFISEHVSTR